MRLLVTGRGTSGSWQIRGVQLGAAIGADVQSDAPGVAGYDAVVLVKRASDGLLARLRAVPIIWDVVDAWPQPGGNAWTRIQSLTWLRSKARRIRPAAIVAATRAMATDCADLGVPVLALPHHARPHQELNPIREAVRAIGYQGGLRYLGMYREMLERECQRRRWRFEANPPTLAEVDIAVALRDASGYPARRWKSNVKLANAQGTATPIVCCLEAGYQETQSGAEYWAEDAIGLRVALDQLTPYSSRARASQLMLRAAPRLPSVAAEYRGWLSTLSF